ncbi:MAG TPA: FAD-binding oxidoreductase, partial [Telluria sp.]|nr:FAD-binding oxidoreductase [Telluria sp.]
MTRLNAVAVNRIVVPQRQEEIVQAVRSHAGAISIGGARYSMGGQIAAERSLHLDMRRYDKVLRFAPQDREITVQAGITWRKVQEVIDPYDLSLQVMQSYANFTVGGSLSVNAHGRYPGQGPLVSTVRSIRMVLADGSLVEASPRHNSELFYGAIGGYGGLGVIVDATLSLAKNEPVARSSRVMPLGEYPRYFATKVAPDQDIIFHNAVLYPDDYDTVRAVSFARTTQVPTEPSRLQPAVPPVSVERALLWATSSLPFGRALRQHVFDPLHYAATVVEWRNYEAGYDVRSLEPLASGDSLYALQEYFVPVAQLEPFAVRMRGILRQHRAQVINVSIRHARRDPGTVLAWAREDVFAFVLFYRQGIAREERAAVGGWTRELIDAATGLGGTYYLPYQIHATPTQFRAAYP